MHGIMYVGHSYSELVCKLGKNWKDCTLVVEKRLGKALFSCVQSVIGVARPPRSVLSSSRGQLTAITHSTKRPYCCYTNDQQ